MRGCACEPVRIHAQMCSVGFPVLSGVFVKLCKVDEGHFDLQTHAYLETGPSVD